MRNVNSQQTNRIALPVCAKEFADGRQHFSVNRQSVESACVPA